MKLEWRQANIRKPVTFRALVTTSDSDVDWEQVAASTWDFFFREIAPLNSLDSWEAVRCEFWMDSGRLIFFVAKAVHTKRIDEGSCELVIPQFTDQWNECADRHADNDEAFVKALIGIQATYARFFLKALKGRNSHLVANEIKGREVLFWNADSEQICAGKI